MRKSFFGIILLAVLLMACASGAKPAASSGGISLDQAIKEAAVRIDERIKAGSKIAPLNFNSPHDKFSGYVLDELTANLVDSGKLTVVDRKELSLIADEVAFQFSGEVGDDTMQEMGRKLGAQSIISGSLTDLGGVYRIVVRVLNVQNASVEVQYRGNIASDTVMAALLSGGKASAAAGSPQRASGGGAAAQTAQAPAQQAAPPTPAAPAAPTTYKIGDKGPAGGIIFLDKGYPSGGWQYLEAASADILGKVKWASNSDYVNGTNTSVGAGKRNTQLILENLRSHREEDMAAQLVSDFMQGGFKDWFLPSKEELNLMYENLKQKGLGGFKSDWYWSSSQYDSDWAWKQNFSNGNQEGTVRKYEECSVRAVRQF